MVESSDPQRVTLRDLFLALQGELAAALNANRIAFGHPGTRGETAELDWVTMLSKYLPARYQASKAFVVDCEGSRSDAIDLVIYDRQYCPFLFTKHGSHYIPAEAVYAVFEIKQTLTREHLAYAAAKALSVRRLKRTSAPIPYASGTYEPRPLFTILAGILALDSSWTPPLGEPLKEVLAEQEPEARLDLGCALQHGAFEAEYEDALRLTKSSANESLIFFFLTLLRRLQALATVPAIDLASYGRFLASEE